MIASRYLAKLIGPLFLVIGAGMLFNRQIYDAMVEQYLSNYALIYLSGLFGLTVGIMVVLAHNVWTPNWRVIITLFGWLLVVGGTVRVVYPQLVRRVLDLPAFFAHPVTDHVLARQGNPPCTAEKVGVL